MKPPRSEAEVRRRLDFESMAEDPRVFPALAILQELKRREEHPSATYQPSDDPKRNQLAFHRSTARNRLLQGGNQSGKSFCHAHEVAWWLQENHPYQKTPDAPRVYVVSAQYWTIQEGVLRHLKEILPEWSVIRWGRNIPGQDIPQYVECRGSRTGRVSRCDFLTAQGGETARKKLQSAAINLLAIDEEIPTDLYQEGLARLLITGGRLSASLTAVRGEPWVNALEDRHIEGDKEVFLTRLSTEKALEVGHVDRGAFNELNASLSEEDRMVRIYGESRRSRGLVYPELCDVHYVDPFPIPRGWRRIFALDPGFRTCAALWVAISPTGHAYAYRELYTHGLNYREIVDEICRREHWVQKGPHQWEVDPAQTENVDVRWVDPAGFGRHETGEPKLANLLANYGIACVPAMNDVEYGIEQVRALLLPGVDMLPKMRIFRTLENFRQEVRSYRRQTDHRDAQRHSRNEAPIKRRDHLMDCWRYICAGGVEYREPSYGRDRMFADPDFGERQLIQASQSMDRVRRQMMQKIAREQRHARRREGQRTSTTGIGSEY